MSRIPRPRRLFPLVSIPLWALFFAGPAAAKSVWGPCTMRDGVCYRSLDEVVGRDRAEAYLRTTPARALRFVTRDLIDKTERWSPALDVGVEVDQAIRGRADARARALSIVEAPWLDDFQRTLVKVEARFPDQPAGTISVCSGTMIGAHTVLTAGHCIYSHDAGGWAEWTYVYPAMAGYHNTPYGEAQGTNLTSTSWWVTDNDHRGDTGIIRLAQDVGDLTGWPAMSWGYGSLSGVINSGGYPADEGYDGYWLYLDAGDVEDLSQYLICHSASTVRGMSGGPGWLVDADSQQRSVTAVNSFCYLETGQCCMARYVDLVEQQRQDAEAEAGGAPPDHWACDLQRFSASDACDCQCGLWDPDCDIDGLSLVGCAAGERCIRPGTCICDPQCDGRECGEDGCGGSCGGCQPGSSCQDGACTCVPQCMGKQCGTDLCGGSCGSCPAGSDCESGICSCSPDCTGLACGPDGCGGSCGSCPAGESCQAGVCACAPACDENGCGPDGCGGSCGTCAGDQTCVDGQCICLDNCQGRECGSDGCGGSCGSCSGNDLCNDGKCIGEGDLGGGSSCGCASRTAQPGEWIGLLLLALGLLLFRERSA